MLYKDGIVSVDRDFARIGSKSYAINKINTVEISEKPTTLTSKGCFGLVLLSFGLFALLVSIAVGIVAFSIATLLFAAGVWMLMGSKRREFQLLLRTSSSEAMAFSSTDHDEVRRLRDAIEEAMVSR